jgi:hypothetical protein
MFIYEELKLVKVPELEPVLNKPAGAGWSLLWHLFFYTRMLKYVHKKQFKEINTSFNKLTTKDKLSQLCKLGYLREVKPQVYIATNKVIPILKRTGFPISILPDQSTGTGELNEMNNTEVLIQATKLPHFYALLYYDFVYIRPDALLVQFDPTKNRYKLTFLEIESKKPNWETYLITKRDNYNRLAKDKIFYDYWKETAPKLHLFFPPSGDLKFSVTFVGNLSKDFGDGFSFISQVSNLSKME